MNNEEEKNNSQETEFEINLSKFVFIVLNILPPLVLGAFFGVTVERFTYGLIILLLGLRYTEACDILEEIKDAVEELQEKMQREQE